MARAYKADLHVHTCLSPCADEGMLPSAIVRCAIEAGLDAIAICDHNSAENVAAVREAARGKNLYVVGGMEITSSEEVHILGLFGGADGLLTMQGIVYDRLPGRNDPSFFGEQLVADAHDALVGLNETFLAGTTELTVDEIVRTVHELGGIAIASHIDRESFGIVGQLGFVPADLELDALELSATFDRGRIKAYRGHGLPLLVSSDAHYPWDIGAGRTTFALEELSFAEIRLALLGKGNRKVEV